MSEYFKKLADEAVEEIWEQDQPKLPLEIKQIQKDYFASHFEILSNISAYFEVQLRTRKEIKCHS